MMQMTVRERESPQKSEHEQTFWCKVDRAGTEKKLIRPDYVNDCHENQIRRPRVATFP